MSMCNVYHCILCIARSKRYIQWACPCIVLFVVPDRSVCAAATVSQTGNNWHRASDSVRDGGEGAGQDEQYRGPRRGGGQGTLGQPV